MKHLIIALVVFGSLPLAFAPSAFAVDGTVLINQATSVNGLPGCTHAGFPIVICQSGSYRLSGNITVSGTTDGIDITADNVTLDLNGFSITGPVVCQQSIPTVSADCSPTNGGWGVNSTKTNTRVINGAVRGFVIGVVSQGSGFWVENIEASGHYFSGIVNTNSSGYSIVRGNNASGNGNIGISVSTGVVSDNHANHNGNGGIDAAYSTVSNNTALGNGGYGIQATCPSSIVGNTLPFNQGGALILNGSGCVDSNNAH